MPAPSEFSKKYDVDVAERVVLDVGAYIGDSVLYWLSKGAREVIAVEPVPAHYKVLLSNVRDKPVVAINAAVGIGIPYINEHIGRRSYGVKLFDLHEEGTIMDVSVVSLTTLVEKYLPHVIKINCEGCEHFCLEDLISLPRFGVQTLIIQIHDLKNRKKEELLTLLQEKFGSPHRIVPLGKDINVIYYF